MVSEKFKEIVKNGDKLEIKVSLKNRLLFARDIDLFDEMLGYVRKNDIDIYEKHDNENFPSEDSGEWNDSLLDKEINNLLDNFSKERISNIRKLIAKLGNKTSSNNNANITEKQTPNKIFDQKNSKNHKKYYDRKRSEINFNKNIGIGLSAVGGLVVVTSLFTGLGVKTLVGVAIAGAGIIILVSEKK